ncbi:hypothetical protein GCM10027082_24200 [Comamonas humi]
MTKEELFAKMTDSSMEIPRVRDVGLVYAAWLEKAYEHLPDRLREDAIMLGAIVNTRSSRLIPVLKEEDVDAWLAYCDKVYGKPKAKQPSS